MATGPKSPLPEKLEYALREQRGRVGVVLGEIVLGAGIDEELRSRHGRREPLRELEVLVALEDVQLQPHPFRPGLRPVVAPLAERQGGVTEHGATGVLPRRSKELCRQHAEREADVEDLARERLDGHTGSVY